MSETNGGRAPGAIDQPYQDSQGVEHTIAESLRKGPVLLALYKSSCAASKVMLPMVQRIQDTHAADGLTSFGIAQDSPNITRSFARRYGISIPILVEGQEYPLSSGFDIRATPTVYVLRTDRSIAYTTMGFLREQVEEIEAAVAAELGVPPVPIVTPDAGEVPFFVPG
jgi:hypothetical protein